MIKGLWKTVNLVCGCHEEEIVMNINNGPHSLFYSCPKYYPENRTKEERVCPNRLNLVDYERMLNRISDEMLKRTENNETTDLTNFKWKDSKSHASFEVLKHDDKEITVKVYNPKAFK